MRLKISIIYFVVVLALKASPQDLSFENFYRAVHTQSSQNNFILFRHRPLVSLEYWRKVSPNAREYLLQNGGLVLVFSKIHSFIRLNEIVSNVGINSHTGANLQFDIKYYETLRDIGINGDFKAMCSLPYLDKCILLGYEMF